MKESDKTAMGIVSQMPLKDAIYDEASLWVTRLERGLSSAEEGELKDWLRKDDENVRIFMELAQQWDEMDSLSRLNDIFPSSSQKVSSFHKAPGYALAASAVIAVALTISGFVFFGANDEAGSYNDSEDFVAAAEFGVVDYETAVGEQSSVVLPDGSEILLNTNTLVSVSYTAAERLIRMQRGELNVQVAHNPMRPFRVVTSDHVVEAVGTAFNMEMTRTNELELLVTDGRVLVAQVESIATSQSESNLNSDLPFSSDLAIGVSAGEEILLGSDDETLKRIQPEEIAVKLSWRDGNLIFQGESLQVAMAEVGRYTSTNFIFLDDATRNVRIAGRFKAGDLDALLATLESSFNISYRFAGDSQIELGTQ